MRVGQDHEEEAGDEWGTGGRTDHLERGAHGVRRGGDRTADGAVGQARPDHEGGVDQGVGDRLRGILGRRVTLGAGLHIGGDHDVGIGRGRVAQGDAIGRIGVRRSQQRDPRQTVGHGAACGLDDAWIGAFRQDDMMACGPGHVAQGEERRGHVAAPLIVL